MRLCLVPWRLGPALALLAAFLAGCGADPEVDGALRLALANAPRNLDPRLATDASSERVNRLFYRRLVEPVGWAE